MASGIPKDGVTLMPFLHQVGGHAGMLKFNNSTVCKPLNQREVFFYQSLPEDMIQFTPEFRGTVNVYVEEDLDGALHLRAYPCVQMVTRGSRSSSSSGEGVDSDESEEVLSCSSSPTASRKLHKSHYHNAHKRKSACMVRVSHNNSACSDEDAEFDRMFEDHSNDSGRPVPCNPWGLHCHHKQVAKMRRDQSTTTCHKFILLENVTSRFRYPCIIDLKMGTRSYGEDFSEEKRKSHIARAKATTSATLGMRICGMQVYNSETRKFVCRNKYYGRRLSKDGLKKGLCDFLYDGDKVRTDLIPHIIHRLKRLIDIVSQQSSSRFYSSSLLIMYEGHVGLGRTCDSSGDGSRDDGGELDCVDIKMIDFANTYHKGHKNSGTATIHSGPDKGYMYGLENLIEMLNNLASKSERLKDTSGAGSTTKETL